MSALPTKGDLDGSAVPFNEGIYKAAIGALRDCFAGLFGTLGTPASAFATLRLNAPDALFNLAPVFSVAASALTITVKDAAAGNLAAANPGFVAQRATPIGTAGFSLKEIVANVALVISSGSTLGHGAGKLCPIYIYLIDNAGAQEVAVAGTFQGVSGIYTTVAEGGAGAADNPDVMYSAVARADKAGRLIACAWSNQAAAGTWAAVPTEVKAPPFHLERVGVEELYMGGTVPYGFFACDGANVSRTTYAKLFAKLGTTWGVGDGATTFGLPDSRRRTAVGSGGAGTGTLGNAVGNVGGAETVALATAELAAHTHTGPSHTHGGATGGQSADHTHVQNGATIYDSAYITVNGGGSSLNLSGGNLSTGGVSVGHTHSISADGTGATGSAGSGTAHNNLQPSMIVTKMIRWLGDI